MDPRWAVLVAASVAVAGCSGSGGKAQTLPTLATSRSASAAASPSATGIAAPTPQGASEFARYFYKQIEKAFETKDPSLVAALSDPTCGTCNNYIASITTLRDQKQRIVGHLVFTIVLAEAPATDGRTARVDVIWNTPAIKRYDASGRLILDQKPLNRVAETLELRRAGERWMVRQMTA